MPRTKSRLVPRHRRTLVAIDPSIQHTGLAIFRWDGLKWSFDKTDAIKLKKRKNRPTKPKGLAWVARCDEMANKIFDYVYDQYNRDDYREELIIVCEMPNYRTAAAAATGAVEKMIALVFTLRNDYAHQGFCTFHLAPVTVWKGNSPKEITQRRMKKRWGWEGKDHNQADAVGIGDWWIRTLDR